MIGVIIQILLFLRNINKPKYSSVVSLVAFNYKCPIELQLVRTCTCLVAALLVSKVVSISTATSINKHFALATF